MFIHWELINLGRNLYNTFNLSIITLLKKKNKQHSDNVLNILFSIILFVIISAINNFCNTEHKEDTVSFDWDEKNENISWSEAIRSGKILAIIKK